MSYDNSKSVVCIICITRRPFGHVSSLWLKLKQNDGRKYIKVSNIEDDAECMFCDTLCHKDTNSYKINAMMYYMKNIYIYIYISYIVNYAIYSLISVLHKLMFSL